jgi:hypothetical protein
MLYFCSTQVGNGAGTPNIITEMGILYPIYGCQTGSESPIVHVKKDQAYPIHFSNIC